VEERGGKDLSHTVTSLAFMKFPHSPVNKWSNSNKLFAYLSEIKGRQRWRVEGGRRYRGQRVEGGGWRMEGRQRRWRCNQEGRVESRWWKVESRQAEGPREIHAFHEKHWCYLKTIPKQLTVLESYFVKFVPKILQCLGT
jgi:hypothetical protein